MKRIVTLISFINALIISVLVNSSFAQQTYYYDFRNTFNEKSGSGPALNVLGTGAFVNEGLAELSCISRPVYGFSQNSGVQFDNAASGGFLSGSYTIEMYFQFLNNSGFKRIIDFKNQSSDSGLYCTANLLQFYNALTINTTAFVSNQYVYLAVSRDSVSEELSLFVDGNFAGAFTDSSGLGILDNSNVLNFFRDDLVFGGEARPGRIALLKIHNTVLDSIAVSNNFASLQATSGSLAFSSDISAACLTGNVFNFTNLSENSGGFSYTWEFGDGNSLNDTNATHSYINAGIYNILLIADNGSGCIDTVSSQVAVFSSAPVSLGADIDICTGDSVVLDAGTGYTSYLWNTGSTNPTITVNNTGTYFVEVIDTTGCAGVDSVNVNIVSYPELELGNDTTLCFGASIILTATQGLATYLWSTGDTTESILVGVAGVYAVEAANAAGCSVADTINLNINPEVIISLGADTSFCSGNTLTLDPGPGFVTYSWSDGSLLQTLGVTASGTYFVDVTDFFGCSVSDTVNVLVNNPVVVDLGADTAFCGGTLVVMDAGSGFAGYLWNDGSQNQTLGVTIGGIYTVIVTEINGCTGTDSISLNASPAISLGVDQFWCTGVSTTLDAGPGFNSYLWNDGSVLQTLDVNVSGTYTITVSDTAGCFNSDVVIVTFNDVPVIELGPDFTICDGEIALLDPGPGYPSYLWNDGSTNTVLEVTAAGTYSVIVSSAANCDAVDTITVSVLPSPPLSLGNDTLLCDGAIITLNAGSGFSAYLWSNGATSQTLDVFVSDIYIVTITGSNGCESTDSVIVFFEAAPFVDLGLDQSFCSGGSVLLDAGPGMLSYLWSDNSTSQSILVTSSGLYAVTITSPAGCTSQDSVSINVLNIPVLNIGPDTIICFGTQLVLDAGPGFNTYQWNDGSVAQTFNVASSGIYTVTISDNNGCTNTDDIFVDYHVPVPTPIVTQLVNTLQSSSASGNQWYSVPGGIIPGATGQTYSPGQNGTYYVTVADSNGCISLPSPDFVFVLNAIQFHAEPNVILYPNPANNTVTITTSEWPAKSCRIEMIDIIGKTVYVQEATPAGKHLLDVSLFPEGIYFIKVSSDKYHIMNRLIINR